MSGPTWFDTNPGPSLGPPYVGWLTPQGELEEAELGERVTDFLLQWDLVLAYSMEARIRCGTTELVGEVGYGTTQIGRPFPPEWWPPSAGPLPEDLEVHRKEDARGRRERG